MLSIEAIECRYGRVAALKGVTLSVAQGEFVALIGPNGAGKTTILRAISGLMPVASGSIAMDGKIISGRPPRDIVRSGIAHSPEERKLWPGLTVLENLQLGAYLRADKAGIDADLARVLALFPRLAERRRQQAGTLSGGEQQMVAVGRALMSKPKLLLLDEPSMGLAPIMVDTLLNAFSEIHRAGTAILLIEQNAFLALSIAGRAYVLNNGAIAREGEARSLLADPTVQSTYLGGRARNPAVVVRPEDRPSSHAVSTQL
jgi:branched-chain amino acid transport system ATP-binding protein